MFGSMRNMFTSDMAIDLGTANGRGAREVAHDRAAGGYLGRGMGATQGRGRKGAVKVQRQKLVAPVKGASGPEGGGNGLECKG